MIARATAIVISVAVASVVPAHAYGAEPVVTAPVVTAKCDEPLNPARDAPQCIDVGTPAPRIGIWAPREYVANVLAKLERAQSDKLAAEKALVEKEKPIAGYSKTTVIVVGIVAAVIGAGVVLGVQRASAK